MKTFLSIVLISGFLLACSSAKKASRNTMNTSSLIETKWVLIEMLGTVESTYNVGKEIFIQLKQGGNLVTGFSGCNTFRGIYSIDPDKKAVDFSKMSATLMACPNLDKERKLLDQLSNTKFYTIEGNKMILYNSENQPLLRFESVTL